jgi:PII-like signaling protein
LGSASRRGGRSGHEERDTTRLLEPSSGLPIVIEVVDETERIEAFLPVLDEMVGDGLITTERVHVVTYRGTPRAT